MKELEQLEETGKYVFHGSPHSDITHFELRQGNHNGMPDGNPAVSATPYVEFAVFRAIINTTNISIPFSSRFGFQDGKREFIVSSQEVLDQIQNKKGFVYVFDKKDFVPYSRDGIAYSNNMEWRSYKTISPISVIEVTVDDLSTISPGVKILDSE